MRSISAKEGEAVYIRLYKKCQDLPKQLPVLNEYAFDAAAALPDTPWPHATCVIFKPIFSDRQKQAEVPLHGSHLQTWFLKPYFALAGGVGVGGGVGAGSQPFYPVYPGAVFSILGTSDYAGEVVLFKVASMTPMDVPCCFISATTHVVCRNIPVKDEEHLPAARDAIAKLPAMEAKLNLMEETTHKAEQELLDVKQKCELKIAELERSLNDERIVHRLFSASDPLAHATVLSALSDASLSDFTRRLRDAQTAIEQVKVVRMVADAYRCSICLDKRINRTLVPCGHCFCDECATRPSCGMCSVAVQQRNVFYLSSSIQ
jgi:hypothetical protein